MNIRNIILIGRTGNGKSTLANVISGTNRFTESSGSVSETRDIQSEIFEINISRDGRERIRYQLIDTVGIGDTQLTPRGVFERIGRASHAMREGLNQILFVTNGRFTQEEAKAYRDLRQVIFDNHVGTYTTIVRTNFPQFDDEAACERDREAMRRENPEMADIINSVRRIIYVDNPPVDTNSRRRNDINQETRNESREKLLIYLGTCQDTYRPENLHNMNERIRDYVTEQERLERELREKEEEIRKQEARMQQELNNLRTQQAQQLAALQTSFQQQMQAANDQRAREIRDLEDKNRREIGQIKEDNDRKLKQMQDDSRRQKEEADKIMKELQEKKNSGASDLSQILSHLNLNSGNEELINQLKEDRKERAKKIEELEGKINQQEEEANEMREYYEEKIEEIKEEIIEQTAQQVQQVQKTLDERPSEVHFVPLCKII